MRVGSQFGSESMPGRGNDIDLHTLGRSLWRKRWKVIGPTLTVALLAIIGVNIVTPKYKSEARLLVEGRENVFVRPGGDRLSADDVRMSIDQEAITSQAQILQSRDIALSVIKSLKLAEKPEFDPALRGVSITGTILSLFGLGRDTSRLTPEERVLATYFEKLSVLPIDKSRVIQIEFQSHDGELAARVVNAVIDTYFEFQRSSKQDQTRNASHWLAVEIEKLRPKVAEAEDAVESFRAKANLFLGNNNSSLASQQLSDMTAQLANARAQKADLDARSRMIREMLRTGRPIEANDITNAELIRRLVEQRVTLRSQFAEQSSTLLDQHPRIKELRAQIGALDSQIRLEAEKLVHSLENDARIAGARIEATSASIEQLKKQIAALSSQDVQLRGLEREAKAQRDLLESYLAKFREANTRDSLDTAPSDVRVISRAIPSNIAAFPKKIPMVAIATLGALFIAVTLIVTSDLLDPNNTRPFDRPTAPVRPGLLARLRRQGKTSAEAPHGVPARVAATRGGRQPVSIGDLALALRRVGEAGRRITVIGAVHNVGTTYTAVGLARALVQQGGRTVLVDLSLTTPNLAIMSTDPDAPGIAELVRGAAQFGDIVTRDRFSGVHLVTLGKVGADASSILTAPRLAMTLEALARTYDHVILDAGAMTDGGVQSFARLAPRAVLVATDLDHPDTLSARDRLVAAGFLEVTLLIGNPGGSSTEPGRAAA